MLYESPGAMQLRYLGTLTEIAVEHNSTIIFPLPIEFMRAFLGAGNIPPPSIPVAAHEATETMTT